MLMPIATVEERLQIIKECRQSGLTANESTADSHSKLLSLDAYLEPTLASVNRCKRFMIQKTPYPCLDKALTGFRVRETGLEPLPYSQRFRTVCYLVQLIIPYLTSKINRFNSFKPFIPIILVRYTPPKGPQTTPVSLRYPRKQRHPCNDDTGVFL